MNMEPDITLIVADKCSPCDYIKDVLKERGVDVKIIDASTDEGFEFITKHKITAVPTCVIRDKEKIRECSDDEFLRFIEG